MTLKKILLTLFAVVFLAPFCQAETEKQKKLPWEKGYVNLGVYVAAFDSSFRIGSTNTGLGLDIDVEQLLGLDSSGNTFRVDAGYRIGRKRRHKIEFSWFSFNREGETQISQDIELPPELGGGTLPNGSTVQGLFNIEIYKLMYRYSLVLDERIDFNIGAGLHITPIEFGFGVQGRGFLKEEITAPLPVLGMGGQLALSSRWFFIGHTDFLFLQYENYKGGILTGSLATEYRFWKHAGIGAALDALFL